MALLATALATTVATAAAQDPNPMLQAVQALAPHPCNSETSDALRALGLLPGQIASARYMDDSTPAAVFFPPGIDVYVTIAGQSGTLVVQHRQGCRVAGTYTMGGLTLPHGPR